MYRQRYINNVETKIVNTIRISVGRSTAVLTVVTLLFVLVSNGLVFAAGGQVQYRAITMSDNGTSGNSTIPTGVGSGTNVSYRVSFKAATAFTLRGVVVDFCSGGNGTPFIGDPTCDAPPDFTVGATPTVDTTTSYTINGDTYSGVGSGWTADSLASGQTFRMTNSTGTALTAGSGYSFTISGVTNPSAKGSFYARLITYSSATGGVASYTHASTGSYEDYGGFALSTADIVQVTAKVQETLVFCMLGSTSGDIANPTPPSDCNDVTAPPPAIILGHGDNNTLDTLQIDRNHVYSIASTNALNGVTVRIHNANTCGALALSATDATCGIPGANSGAGTTPSSPITAGIAAFGLSILSNIDMVAQAPYDGDPDAFEFGLDTTTVGDNVKTTFGSKAVASSGPIGNVTNRWTFGATASPTTPAGVYTANISAIATGTF